MYQLLFVDDDENLLKINRVYFKQHGYSVATAATADLALSLIAKQTFHCIVLDIILPPVDDKTKRTDGYEICRRIKEHGNTPIIFLTSLAEQDFLYRGFVSGGDDYMTKPYDLRELEMRIMARINSRTGIGKQNQSLHFPHLILDLTGRTISIDSQQIALTSNEFDILAFLAASPGQPFTTEAIYREVWKMPELDSTHTVQVHVARMRRKLESAYPSHKFVTTAWGKGYLFSPGED